MYNLMNEPILEEKSSIFALMDKEDEKQVLAVEAFLDPELALVYKVLGKTGLSYQGAKYLAQWSAENGYPMTTTKSSFETVGTGEEAVIWCYANVRNDTTKLEPQGVGQCPQYLTKKDGSKIFDALARTKAHSKAERNGIRKNLPEAMILKFIKMAEEKKGGVQELNKSENNSSGPAATKTTFTNTVCQCVTPAPKFDENHTCASCNKPVPKEKCSICKVKKE